MVNDKEMSWLIDYLMNETAKRNSDTSEYSKYCNVVVYAHSQRVIIDKDSVHPNVISRLRQWLGNSIEDYDGDYVIALSDVCFLESATKEYNQQINIVR
jgi:hypothetical protein